MDTRNNYYALVLKTFRYPFAYITAMQLNTEWVKFDSKKKTILIQYYADFQENDTKNKKPKAIKSDGQLCSVMTKVKQARTRSIPGWVTICSVSDFYSLWCERENIKNIIKEICSWLIFKNNGMLFTLKIFFHVLRGRKVYRVERSRMWGGLARAYSIPHQLCVSS